ncbi:MAG: hypothetical protein JWO31_338 [Phycisphaerales bacterium]|nr:hypothetical protein [Phycisphaerales bacterium]
MRSFRIPDHTAFPWRRAGVRYRTKRKQIIYLVIGVYRHHDR